METIDTNVHGYHEWGRIIVYALSLDHLDSVTRGKHRMLKFYIVDFSLKLAFASSYLQAGSQIGCQMSAVALCQFYNPSENHQDEGGHHQHRNGAAGRRPGAGVQAAAYPGHEEHGAGLWAVEGGGRCVEALGMGMTRVTGANMSFMLEVLGFSRINCSVHSCHPLLTEGSKAMRSQQCFSVISRILLIIVRSYLPVRAYVLLGTCSRNMTHKCCDVPYYMAVIGMCEQFWH